MNFLLVDDSKDSRLLAKEMLKKGFPESNITEASSFQEAKQLIFENSYQLIITDLVMPEEDGVEVIKFARNDPRGHVAPILVITGNKSPEDKVRCKEAGATAFLNKPINYEILIACIKHLLDKPSTEVSEDLNQVLL